MVNEGIPEGVKGAIGWALGVGIIALILLVLLILFGNLSGNLGFDQETYTATNESADSSGISIAHANTTGYTLNGTTLEGATSYTITAAWADIIGTYGYNLSVPLANVSVSTAGVLTNGTVIEYDNLSVSYTNTFNGLAERNTNDVITNYSTSAVNISAQFPTVGTIIGIALLLIVLIGILVFAVSKLMQAANTGTSGKSSTGSGFEQGGFG